MSQRFLVFALLVGAGLLGSCHTPGHGLIANRLVRDLNLRPLRLCPIRIQNIARVRSCFVSCSSGRIEHRRYPDHRVSRAMRTSANHNGLFQ